MIEFTKRYFKEVIKEKYKKLRKFTFKKIFTSLMNKMLIRSVKRSSMSLCSTFLKLGADINCKDNKGRTLIQVVIDDTKIKDDDTEESLQSRKDKMIDFLYSKGINMDNASNDCTALQQACDSDDVKLVRTLIKLDSKINLKNSKGNTALLSACHKNNYIVAKELLINKANVKISNLDGITPLHYAVKNGNLTLVKKLINIDKNIVNEKDKYGNTPLMYACYNEHFEIVKVLLDNNANPNIDNSNGETTIHIAFYKKDFAMLQLLINNGTDIDKQQGENKETVLHMACKDNLYTDYAIFLIRMGANVDIQTNTGWTPLHYACSNNNCRLAKYLIESGANVYTKTTENYSPLGICLKNKYYNISLWLIRSDIRLIYEKYDYNWELIHYAVKNNWLQLVEVLFKIGVDLEAKTRDNLTPIDIAKVSGNSSMLRFLNEKIKLKKNMGVSNNVRLKLKPSKTRVCVKSSNNNNRMLASQIKLTDASNRMVSLQNCENKIIKGSNINENKLISVYNMYSYNKNQNDNKLQYKNNSRSIGFYY